MLTTFALHILCVCVCVCRYVAIDSAQQPSKSDNAAVQMLQITQTGCWHVQIHTAEPQKGLQNTTN